jgi:hypothetical protein
MVLKTKMFLMLALVMMVVAAPAFSGEAVQMWKCEIDDAVNEDQVEAHAATWLAAAKKVPGGENLQAFVLFPVAVNATGEMDVMFVVVAPSFAEWGKFWDAYNDSDAADIEEDAEEMIVCPDSAVWESVTLE